MTIDDTIIDDKIRYDINREAAKISALSSGKIDKYEFLTGEEILSSDQSRIIKQAKFRYSPLGKAFEKQIKTIEEKGKKQVEALEVLKPNVLNLTIKDMIPENTLTEEAKNERLETNNMLKKIIKKQLSDHHNNLQCLRIKHLELSNNLLQLVPKVVFRILLRNISNSLRMSNIQQLKTKNKKIHKLKPKEQHIPYQVPIINLTDYDIDSSCLKYGLHHSFIDKNRFIKRDLGVELESLAASVD